MADQQHGAAAPVVLLDAAMDLADQRAGGIGVDQLAALRLGRHRLGHAVRREHHERVLRAPRRAPRRTPRPWRAARRPRGGCGRSRGARRPAARSARAPARRSRSRARRRRRSRAGWRAGWSARIGSSRAGSLASAWRDRWRSDGGHPDARHSAVAERRQGCSTAAGEPTRAFGVAGRHAPPEI